MLWSLVAAAAEIFHVFKIHWVNRVDTWETFNRREQSRYNFESYLRFFFPHMGYIIPLGVSGKMRKKIIDAFLTPNWCYPKHASHQISITFNTAQHKAILTIRIGLNPVSLQTHMNSLLYKGPGSVIHFDKTLLSSIKTAWVFCLPILGPPTAAIETNGKIPIYFHRRRAKPLETFVFKEKHFFLPLMTPVPLKNQ